MASIKLEWSNTTSLDPIVGYEIDYKLTSDISYITLIDIVTSDTFGEYTWNGASYNTSYDFRIRTKDEDNDFSSYKYVSISTFVIGNLPPETVDSYNIIYKTSSTIALDFSGSSDDYGIKGHEVSYKRTIASDYTTLPFITTSSGSFFIIIDSLQSKRSYNIIVRTQDIHDIWSENYFNIIESTLDSDTSYVNRSITYLDSGNACYLEASFNQLYYTSSIIDGNIFYIDGSLTIPFDGDDKVWCVSNFYGSWSVKISGTGVMSEISLC